MKKQEPMKNIEGRDVLRKGEKYRKILRRSGFNDMQIATVLACIAENDQDIRAEVEPKALMMFISVACNVLSAEGYWEKSAKKKLPKFLNECFSLYTSLMDGLLTWEEVADFNAQSGIICHPEYLNVAGKTLEDMFDYEGKVWKRLEQS